MYHSYAGSGEISDSSGTIRVIQVTAIISDILLTGHDEPIKVMPGQPLQSSRIIILRFQIGI